MTIWFWHCEIIKNDISKGCFNIYICLLHFQPKLSLLEGSMFKLWNCLCVYACALFSFFFLVNYFFVNSPFPAEVVVSPPYVFLPLVKGSLRSDFHVAAQNCWVSKGGAYTGEVR